MGVVCITNLIPLLAEVLGKNLVPSLFVNRSSDATAGVKHIKMQWGTLQSVP